MRVCSVNIYRELDRFRAGDEKFGQTEGQACHEISFESNVVVTGAGALEELKVQDAL